MQECVCVKLQVYSGQTSMQVRTSVGVSSVGNIIQQDDIVEAVFSHEEASASSISARRLWISVCRKWRDQHRKWISLYFAKARIFCVQELPTIMLVHDDHARLQTLVNGMDEFLFVQEVQVKGCVHLCAVLMPNLTAHTTTIPKLGGIGSILRAMLKYRDNSVLCWAGMTAMMKLYRQPANAQKVQEAGVQTHIIELLRSKASSHDVYLIRMCLDVLYHQNPLLEVTQQKVAVVFDIMTLHSHDDLLQITAMSTMLNIMYTLPGEDEVMCVERVHVKIILDTIRNHMAESLLVTLGCRIIRNLAANGANKQLILETGGLDMVEHVHKRYAKRFNTSVETCQTLLSCVQVLRGVSWGDPSSKGPIRALVLGGWPPVRRMRTGPD